MKKIFKRAIILAPGVFLALSVILPAVVLSAEDNAGNAAKNFCSRLSNVVSKIDQRLAANQAKLQEKREQISGGLSDRWAKRDESLTKKRDKWDENREKHYEKLKERAQNDVQKQAVETFKNAIEAAAAARQTAINTALKTFRTGVEQALVSRKTTADTALTVFRNSIKSAFDQAKSSCAGAGDAKTIREALLNSLKTAKENFTTDKQAIDNLGSQISQLVTTRNQALQKAMQDYKQAVERARDTLKVVFPQE